MILRTNSIRSWLATLSFVALFSTPTLWAATSVSQYGITWTFSADHQVGQYANGDYYVVGPVTIVEISPASVVNGGRTINGSWINPTSGDQLPPGPGYLQPFDSAMYGSIGPIFDATLNAARPNGASLSAANPLNVPAGSSIVSTISEPVAGHRPQIRDAAILTVVSAAPPAGSFRPPYVGTNKTHSWNKSSLNYNIFRSLAKPGNTPALSTVEGYLQRPWLEFHTSAFSQYTHATNNGPNYGREISWQIGDAALSLHLDYSNAQKETLLVRMVQLGIDIYGAAAFSKGNWEDLDGINNGRKLPLVIAALALNDANMKNYADGTKHFIFSEDRQTFIVTAADVGKAVYQSDGNPRVPYIAADIGLPEWGGQHAHALGLRDGRNWADMAYRDIAGTSFAGMVLAAHLLAGGAETWNWSPLFRYTDRYMLNPINNLGSPVQAFHQSMWNAYRSLSPLPVDNTTPTPGTGTDPATDAQVTIKVE